MAEHGALEKPWVRAKLIRDLARGENTQRELAARYGCTQQSISDFGKRHVERIAELAGRLDDEFADLWAADKRNRLAVLQSQIEDIADTMADPEQAARAGMQAAEMHRVQQQALRAIADELGQIPGRVQVQHSGQLDIRVNGVDLAALT